jgi:hypothetical protein
MTAREIVLAVLVVALSVALAAALRLRRPRALRQSPGAARTLVPFAGTLEPRVLEAAIRITSAEHGVLVPAYLLVVPLEYAEDSPQLEQVARAMPLLEAVERAGLEAGVPVDARIEKGRTLTHALKRLWEVERFDRIVVPAGPFTPKELAWLLTNSPTETVVLKPEPVAA